MRKDRIAYWIFTGLLCTQMLLAVGMYIFNNEEITKEFIRLRYPDYLVYPLAMAKFLGIVTILYDKWKVLKEWAYAGFFFNFILAFSAHLDAKDGEFPGALAAFIFLNLSYFFYKKSSKQ